ncbi:unnamed protein product [Soboliphyme baturini]|uniref:Uncharacterized protein n=1 Tax=Soboliphyme baturini TaxID=241478 RepID=A0A183IXK3_9BILA|nr:unnamed protein product [Soboliphyme baturini]
MTKALNKLDMSLEQIIQLESKKFKIGKKSKEGPKRFGRVLSGRIRKRLSFQNGKQRANAANRILKNSLARARRTPATVTNNEIRLRQQVQRWRNTANRLKTILKNCMFSAGISQPQPVPSPLRQRKHVNPQKVVKYEPLDDNFVPSPQLSLGIASRLGWKKKGWRRATTAAFSDVRQLGNTWQKRRGPYKRLSIDK